MSETRTRMQRTKGYDPEPFDVPPLFQSPRRPGAMIRWFITRFMWPQALLWIGLGALTYHALTGRPPFTGDTPIAVSLAQATETPVAPSQLRSGLDSRWDAFVLEAMSKDPHARFASAEVMRDAIPQA